MKGEIWSIFYQQQRDILVENEIEVQSIYDGGPGRQVTIPKCQEKIAEVKNYKSHSYPNPRASKIQRESFNQYSQAL